MQEEIEVAATAGAYCEKLSTHVIKMIKTYDMLN